MSQWTRMVQVVKANMRRHKRRQKAAGVSSQAKGRELAAHHQSKLKEFKPLKRS